MPFTAQEITDAGKIGLDFYVKNKPIDNYNVERPLLKCLLDKAKEFPGAKQFVVEQLRTSNQNNFQWYYGAQQVTYNSRQSIEQSNFPWRGAHDGFYLDEDRLLQNGIVVTDSGKGKNATRAEVLQLTNLLEEEFDVLRLGFEERFDQDLHRDGSSSSEAIEGIDHLINLSPSTQTDVGGINAVTNTFWRNYVKTGLTASTLLDEMEIAWRECTRQGGRPDKIIAGETFIDTYRQAIRSTSFGRYTIDPTRQQNWDAGINTNGTDSGFHFKGVPIIWDPDFKEVDTLDSPATTWVKRCYFINTRHLRLRPAQGHNMVTRKPPRQYNRYVHYWALTWKGALCTNRRNAHAVMAIA